MFARKRANNFGQPPMVWRGCRNGMAGKPQYGGGEGRNGIAQQPPLGFASTLLVWRNGPIGLSEQPRLMQWDAAIPIGAEKFCV